MDVAENHAEPPVLTFHSLSTLPSLVRPISRPGTLQLDFHSHSSRLHLRNRSRLQLVGSARSSPAVACPCRSPSPHLIDLSFLYSTYQTSDHMSHSPTPKHLTLHIPNSYPRSTRSTSPTLSRSNSPTSPRPTSPISPPTEPRSTAPSFNLPSNPFKSRQCQGETSRDFLARERTFFSWLRLAQILSILSGAILLRLKPKSSIKKSSSKTLKEKRSLTWRKEGRTGEVETEELKPSIDESQSKPKTSRNLSALQKYIIRKNYEDRIRLNAIFNSSSLTEPNFINPIATRARFPFSASLQLSNSSLVTSTLSSPSFHSGDTNPLSTDHTLSLTIGAIFFIISLITLSIGWFDYMRCVKYLEITDKDEVEGWGNAEDPDGIVRSESGIQRERERSCDAAVANMAHSGK